MDIIENMLRPGLGKEKLLYMDNSGNKLFGKKFSNGNIQIYAVNKEGSLVNKKGVITMMKRAGYKR